MNLISKDKNLNHISAIPRKSKHFLKILYLDTRLCDTSNERAPSEGCNSYVMRINASAISDRSLLALYQLTLFETQPYIAGNCRLNEGAVANVSFVEIRTNI